MIGRDQQPVMLEIQGHRADTAEGFVVDIGEAGIDLQIVQQAQDFDGCTGQDGEHDFRMGSVQRRGQRRHDRQRGRNRRDAQMPGQPPLKRLDFLPHGPCVADDTPSPIEHPHALRREADEAGAAADQQHAQAFLQLFQPGRQRGLGHPARLGRAPEVLLPRQGQHHFQLVDHACERAGRGTTVSTVPAKIALLPWGYRSPSNGASVPVEHPEPSQRRA